MNLIASLVVRNEMSRYLEPCIESLLEFVDGIRVLDDGSGDGTLEYLLGHTNRKVRTRVCDNSFFTHEGRTRNALLDWTMDGEPTHILAIDADEIIEDGALLRRQLEASPDEPAWGLEMVEVWKVSPEGFSVRCDGGWVSHPVTCLYRVPDTRQIRRGNWRIADRALACGRTPMAVNRIRGREIGTDILHFGWARESERETRYQRYVKHDGGNFHAAKHLDSIMWSDSMVSLHQCEWPVGLMSRKEDILRRTGYSQPIVQDPGQVTS